MPRPGRNANNGIFGEKQSLPIVEGNFAGPLDGRIAKHDRLSLQKAVVALLRQSKLTLERIGDRLAPARRGSDMPSLAAWNIVLTFGSRNPVDDGGLEMYLLKDREREWRG